MKGTFATHGLKMVVAMFFLFGGLLLTNRAEAQVVSSTTNNQAPAQLNWLTEQEALAVLEVQVQNLATTLQSLIPGSPGYINTERHIRYYKEIYRQIDAGSIVPEAVQNALGAISEPSTTGVPSKALIGTMYDEAVDLLTS